MSPVTTRRAEADEEEFYSEEELAREAEAAAEAAAAPAPAVSDRRRRRQAKRGETVPASAAGQPSASPVAKKDRPTPSQRGGGEVAEVSRSPIARVVRGVRSYFHEVQVELSKVAWPTREETLRLTWIVIAVSIASAAFLGLVSFLFSLLTTQMATPGSETLAGLFGILLVILVAAIWLMRERIFKPLE